MKTRRMIIEENKQKGLLVITFYDFIIVKFPTVP